MATPSPARRKGAGHKRNSSLQWLVDALFSPSEKEKEVLKPFNPEEITKQERISRMLHNPKVRKGIPDTVPAKKAILIDLLQGPIFEHFLLWRYPSPSSLDNEPTVLYHFPPDKAITIPGLVDFCFPHGWARWLSALKRTSSSTSLGENSGSQSVGASKDSFAFMLTTEDGALYGAVVHSQVDEHFSPSGAGGDPAPKVGPAALLEPVSSSVPLCMCFLSRFPFFQLHFEVLESIVGVAAEYFSPSLQMSRRDALLASGFTAAPKVPSLLHHSLDISAGVPRKSAPGTSSPSSIPAVVARSPLAGSLGHHARSVSSQLIPASSAYSSQASPISTPVAIVVSSASPPAAHREELSPPASDATSVHSPPNRGAAGGDETAGSSNVTSSSSGGTTSPASATSPPAQLTGLSEEGASAAPKPNQNANPQLELRFSSDDIESPPPTTSTSTSALPGQQQSASVSTSDSSNSPTTAPAENPGSAPDSADTSLHLSTTNNDDANDSVHVLVSPVMSPRGTAEDSPRTDPTAGTSVARPSGTLLQGALGVPLPLGPYRTASAPVLIEPTRAATNTGPVIVSSPPPGVSSPPETSAPASGTSSPPPYSGAEMLSKSPPPTGVQPQQQPQPPALSSAPIRPTSSLSPPPQTEKKEKETSPITKILKAYFKLAIAERGKSMHLFVPGQSAAKFTRPPRLSAAVSRLDDEEEKLMAEYGLAQTIASLSRKALMFLLSATLLEKKVAVYSPSPRVVSSVILSVIPLIRPFQYQCSMIPILPVKLQSFLDAPTPFLVGLVSLPSREELPKDVMIINVESDSVLGAKFGDIPNLPNFEELDKKVRTLERQFKKLASERAPASSSLSGGHSPLPGSRSGSLSMLSALTPQISQDQTSCLDQLTNSIQEHMASRFANLRKHCIRDLTDKQKPITVFLKESFLEEIAEEDEAFYVQFFETQTWLNYVDAVLRDADTVDQQQAQQSSS